MKVMGEERNRPGWMGSKSISEQSRGKNIPDSSGNRKQVVCLSATPKIYFV